MFLPNSIQPGSLIVGFSLLADVGPRRCYNEEVTKATIARINSGSF